MERVKVTVRDKVYYCFVAKTEEERRKGLQDRDILPLDEGMLFVFPKEGTRQFWMKDTKIALDQISINSAEDVVQVYEAQPESDELIKFPHCKYLLEVNTDSGIHPGDNVDIDFTDISEYKLKVLGSDGMTQGLLKGGERIFSRVSTKKFIKYAKAAAANKDNSQYKYYCKKLGKAVLKELYAQDHRDQEYVELPT